MALGYDNYSTSFQSLYSPMGIVQSNYSYVNPGAGMNGAAGGYIPGYPGYPGTNSSNTNISNNYYGGFYDPLANQMTTESLLKHEKDNNDYYARPIPAYIKDDNTGTILGAIATGISALALLAALRKGKPVMKPRSGAGAPHAPGFNPAGGARSGASANPTGTAGATGPKPGATAGTGATTGAPSGAGTPPNAGARPNPATGANPNSAAQQPSNPALGPHNPNPAGQSASSPVGTPNTGAANQTAQAPVPQPALPQYTSRMQAALDKQAAAMNLPSSGQVYTTPYTQPALPQYTSRMQAALDKQAAAMNLPSSGQVYTTPYYGVNLPPMDKLVKGNNASSFVKEGAIPERYLHPYIDPRPVYRKGLPQPKQPVAALPQHTAKVQAALDKQAAAMNLPSSGKIYAMPGEIEAFVKANKNIFGNVQFNADALKIMKQNQPEKYSQFVSDFNNLISSKGSAGVIDLIANNNYKGIFEIIK